MKVLIACEFSGVVRDAFAALGHDAWSCDLLPSDTPGNHFQKDVRELLCVDWDMMIAHPPCTYVCGSGIHWNSRRPERAMLTQEAINFVKELWQSDIPRIALENPIGILSRPENLGKPSQIIQPWQFGHDASKSTCLWLKGLPLLSPTRTVEPRMVEGRKRWGNQTDSGQNKLTPSEDRWKLRSVTYQGIADAMAAQWTEVFA